MDKRARKGPNVYISGLLVHAKRLRQCAKEIAAAGHNGWGNTCSQAAQAIDNAVQQADPTSERETELLGVIREAHRRINDEWGGDTMGCVCIYCKPTENSALQQQSTGE